MEHARQLAGKRLFIGPANYAGQAYHWAEAAAEHLGVPATSFAPDGRVVRVLGNAKYQFPVHRSLPHHRLSTPWGKRLRMAYILRRATHLAVDGFLSVYGRMDRSHVGEDFHRLQRQGLQVALVAHGSDIRNPDSHMSRYAFSYYAEAPEEWVGYLRRYSQRNRAIASSLGVPLFVSTPDLLLDAPDATWLPLRVDLALWRTDRSTLERAVPTVLHVPSRRNPPIKGTKTIEQVLRSLEASKRIRYLAPDVVPHRSMPQLVRNVDIVVDQILAGYYGVAAVEGMAAGRLVVGFVGEDVRALMPEPPPIVDAPPERFGAVMDEILVRRDHFAKMASAGPAYAQRWHGGAESAEALRTFVECQAGRVLPTEPH